MDQHGCSWTVILHPEKRKVGCEVDRQVAEVNGKLYE
jgi:hypothetical protein